tara:strand:+ start:31221 stop:32171 length:951 start_codon:yes stop_codon:yes gene_type:complete
MKTVITGGCGFLGRLLAARLVARGDNVTLFDLGLPPEGLGGLEADVNIVLGDITDPKLLSASLQGADAVVHLASMVSAGAEADFDAAMRVNIDGGRAVLEAARAEGPATKVLFTSSLAIFGSAAMPASVDMMTRPVPQNTYGMTKAVMELIINDMSRKGLIDGRIARLPTIIVRPGKPNAAASSFASGVIREPLAGDVCRLPVPRDMALMVGGYRACADGLIALLDAPRDSFVDDRTVNLPNLTVTVAEMIDATKRVAARHNITLGAITDVPDAGVQAIVGSWPTGMDATRAEAIGCPRSASLEAVIEEFIADYVP